ncbi:MAG: hypothetical protein Tsb0010_02070 [Parvularculaceae bacterium]
MTLTETLVALALASVVLLALFQSASMWLLISGRSAAAAESALSGALTSRQFDQIVRGLIPTWPEDEQNIFRGTPQRFSGLTRRPLHSPVPTLAGVTLELTQEGGVSRLAYHSGGVIWRLANLEMTTGEFSYLGADGQWRAEWPPEATPEFGPFNDARLIAPPQLPLAIRLSYRDAGGRPRALIAAITSDPSLPLRDRDVIGR